MPRTTSLQASHNVSVELKFNVELNSYERQTSFCEIVICINKGKGGNGVSKCSSLSRKSVKDDHKERIFTDFVDFLKKQIDFGQWCMRVLESDMSLMGR